MTESLVEQQRLVGARVDDLAPELARAGTDVHHEVGQSDRLLVVLHHDDRVAEVP